MILFRAALLMFALAGWTSGAWADAKQDRLNRISADVAALFQLHAQGVITDDELTQRTEALLLLDSQLRGGKIAPEDIFDPRWRDYDAPVFTAGFELVIADLPTGYSAPITAFLPDGRALRVEAYRTPNQDPGEITISMPVHPDGLDHGGALTFHFGGPVPLAALSAELAPVVEIDNALPRLMRLMTGIVVAELLDEGISPETLLAQLRASPASVDPEHGLPALLLWAWSEAGRGNPALAFIRDGRFDTEFWRDFGHIANPALPTTAHKDSEASWNLAASAALQNILSPELMMRPVPEALEKIRANAPPATPKVYKIRDSVADAGATETELATLAALVVQGRQLDKFRNDAIGGLKAAHKVGDLTLAWTPETALGSLAIGSALTITDHYLRYRQRDFPTKIELHTRPQPDQALADDSRPLDPKPTLIARSPSYKGLAMADGVDLGLMVAQIGLELGAHSKYGHLLEAGELAAKQVAMLSKGNLVSKTTVGVKEVGERVEKLGELVEKDKFKLYEWPGRTWRAPVTKENFAPFFRITYRGEASVLGYSYDSKACWRDTGEGVVASLRARPQFFGGATTQGEARWPVNEPTLVILPDTALLDPGQSTSVRFERSGAEAVSIRSFPPALGALSAVSNDTAIYTAPEDIPSCSETVVLRAEYPTGAEAANICTAPPKFAGSVVIQKGDAKISTPTQISCRDGEVRGFTVAHRGGADVQCVLNGPGSLTMVGNEGLLDCPVEPKSKSSITCFTGAAPQLCAPVIPIKRIFPDYAVTAMVSADRETPLNDNITSFFDDCGVEDLTSLALGLLDGGSGKGKARMVDPVVDTCATNPFAAADTPPGSASAFETPAQGSCVANWPMGEGRDVTVRDSSTYRHRPYDPGRGPGDRSVLVRSDITASVTFDGPEKFTVTTDGATQSTSARAPQDIPEPRGGFADWSVWRRIVVDRDTELRVNVATNGPAISTVQVAPLRLVDNVPVVLLQGFDQNMTSIMMVGNAQAGGLIGGRSATSTAILPGPPKGTENLTYLILFHGRVGALQQVEDRAISASRTEVAIDIRPAGK